MLRWLLVLLGKPLDHPATVVCVIYIIIYLLFHYLDSRATVWHVCRNVLLPQWSCLSSTSVAVLVFSFISISCCTGLFFNSVSCHPSLVFPLQQLPQWSCFSSLSLATLVLSCYQCSHWSHFSGEQATPTAPITIDTCKMKVADYMSKYRITEN